MYLRITSDANRESGVGSFVDDMSGPIRKYFLQKEYGIGLNGIVVIIMCRNSDLNFKQRIRFSKDELILYMDVMLNLEEMIKVTDADKKHTIGSRIVNELTIALDKYSISNFDKANFIQDLKNLFI